MGTYPILAYISFGKEINFQNKRQKTESKNYNCLSFMLSVFINNCKVMFFIVYKITKLRLMIISLKLKVIMEWT
jgi:hypothetical protein